MTGMTRGPLPPRVYWRRRLFAVGLVATLVFVVVSAVRGGGEPPDDGPVATQAAAEPSSAPTTGPEQEGRQPRPGQRERGARPSTPPEPVLAEPEGACLDSDVLITPVVEEAVAGRDVTVTLQLRTAEAAACTWRVGAQHVTMKITSGSDQIWTSLQCPQAIPRHEVVVRQAVTTFVDVVWNARRSDDGCPQQTDWALPGTYHVAAAALGGEPADARFELERPSPEVITEPARPHRGEGRQVRRDDPSRHEDRPKLR